LPQLSEEPESSPHSVRTLSFSAAFLSRVLQVEHKDTIMPGAESARDQFLPSAETYFSTLIAGFTTLQVALPLADIEVPETAPLALQVNVSVEEVVFPVTVNDSPGANEVTTPVRGTSGLSLQVMPVRVSLPVFVTTAEKL